jgi:hypothetical protein
LSIPGPPNEVKPQVSRRERKKESRTGSARSILDSAVYRIHAVK